MFMNPETLPADRPPISAVTDQNELWEREGAPAPPANTNTATRVSCAREPITRKAAANIMAMAATPDRPARQPFARAMASLSKPPRGEQTAMEMNGSIE